MAEKPKAIIVDVDGTVALICDRNPYDTALADQDKPNVPVIECVKAMHAAGYSVVFCSGRHERFREVTEAFIDKHLPEVRHSGLLMRADDDYRRDSIVKRELYERHIKDRFEVLLAIDDRRQVVQEAWRALGLVCLQCAEGDF